MHESFKEDYSEAISRLNQAIKDSQTITKTIEDKLNEQEFENLMAVMRRLMPAAIENLGAVYCFLNKYESNGHAAEFAKNDL